MELSPYVYVPEFYPQESAIEQIRGCDNKLYYATKTGEIYVWEMEEGRKPEKCEIQLAGDRIQISAIAPDQKDNLFVIYRDDPEGDVENSREYLAKYDAAGEELFRKEIGEWLSVPGSSEKYFPEDLAVDAEGNLFLRLGDAGVRIFDAQGNACMLARPEGGMPIGRMTGTNGGRIFCSGKDSVQEVVFEKGFVSSFRHFCNGNGLTDYGEDGLLTNYNSTLYLYHPETQRQEALLQWMNCEIESASVRQFVSLSDTRLVVLLRDEASGGPDELAVLTCMEREKAPQKEIITVGTLQASPGLQRAVAEFNRNHPKYRVEVKEYYDSTLDFTGQGREEAITRFHLELVSGRCPDILNLEYADLDTYYEKGVLEDLTPYLEKEGKLSYDQNIVDAYSRDGKLIALPNTIRIRTIVGKTSFLDGMTSWTLEEMMSFVEEQGDETVFEVSPELLLEYCYCCNQKLFIDAAKSCNNVDTELLRRVLVFCKAYGNPAAEYSPYQTVFSQNRQAQLYEVLIRNASDVDVLRQLLGSDQLTFIAFPTDTPYMGNVMEEVEGAYGICRSAGNKEAAWTFLRGLLTDTEKVTIRTLFSGLPAEAETRQRYFSMAMEDPFLSGTDQDGKIVMTGNRRYLMIGEGGVKYYVPRKSDVAVVQYLLGSSRIGADKTIWNIVLEEARAYFAGQKTVEEVTKLIDNRVRLYLSE